MFCIVLGPIMMSVSQNDSSSRVNVFFRSFVTRALRCVEPTSTEFQPQLLTDLSRLSNGCSLYVWCLVCPRSHSALPLCLHFHRPFAHIRSSFRRTFFMDSSSLLCLPPLVKPHPFAILSRHQDRIWQSNTPYHISITLCTIFHNIRNL